jgi:lysophospholipase L1-like esterase
MSATSRRTRNLSAIALSAIVAGCGGSSERLNVYGTPCLDHVRIQLFGDSTMVGYSWTPSGYLIGPDNPSTALKSYFDVHYGVGVVNVESRAVARTTAKQLVAGTDGLNQPWPQSVDADLVVMNHGMNDLIADGSVLTLTPAGAPDHVTILPDGLPAYRTALETLSRAPAVVIFETPNVNQVWDLAPYAQTMRDVAKEHGISVADTFAYTHDKADLLSDWTHPTDALYSMISANVMQVTAKAVVSKLRCE